MVIDGHCHAWRHWPYDRAVPDPTTRGSIESLLHELDQHGVDHATVVCARIGGGAGGDGFPNPDNNDYVSDFARRHPDRFTAWVDVDCSWRPEHHRPGAAMRLREELERCGARGFTHYVGPENDGWLSTDEGRELFRTAAELGVVASLAAGPPWFDDLAEIARDNPTLPILLHHLSGARLRPEERDVDVARLSVLADLPNVGVKVSGFNYHASRSWEFPYPEAQQLFRRVRDLFGPRRLYWGSDFPASRDMLTYRQAIEVVRSGGVVTGPDLDLILGQNLERLLAEPVLTG